MLRKKLIKTITIGFISITLIATNVFADYGAKGASQDNTYTLESMLHYALEDEYLALNEYEWILDNFNITRPFTNIIRAEQNHIQLLEGLYGIYNIPLIEVNPQDYMVDVASIEEAFRIGIEAEIKNIEMYERFLEQELPDDVRKAFESLKKASESHLKAFERSLSSNKNTSFRPRRGF